ncbi:hypothetical protein SNA_28025 [Streptomyces natalensis ATCC 27448]|uniref:Secreted protein n=1 Tax=Streptomyces natalensis ATCC 27448 TaxID=1240678 RepID=A0A0D7CGT7_9ACTN|nr:hypothetical protein SNA_28025 [Streptomyces natalensis ATCC 27448]
MSSTAFVIALPGVAEARISPGGGEGSTSGGARGGSLFAGASETQIKLDSPSGSGNLAPVNTSWKPPVCWYEPVVTPKQLEAGYKRMKRDGSTILVSPSWRLREKRIRRSYKENVPYEGTPGYKNFNLDKQGKGAFWRGIVNPNRDDDYNYIDGGQCEKRLFWVDKGKEQNTTQGVDPKVLAEYAYNAIKVPDAEVEMNPKGTQTVNLASWVWLDKAKFKPVSVTATLDSLHLTATTTAKPVSLHIDPGTSNAEVYPASGDCPINDDGSIGTPYKKGQGEQDPPCGITYLRATTNAPPYKLKATVTWKISWKGSGGTGGDLPDGTFGTSKDITVQEVQAINR